MGPKSSKLPKGTLLLAALIENYFNRTQTARYYRVHGSGITKAVRDMISDDGPNNLIDLAAEYIVADESRCRAWARKTRKIGLLEPSYTTVLERILELTRQQAKSRLLQVQTELGIAAAQIYKMRNKIATLLDLKDTSTDWILLHYVVYKMLNDK